MPSERQSLGSFGERVAAAHLEAKGYRIIDRNFRVPEAELDLIAFDRDELVFVEVRTRRGGYTGMAALSVGPRKAKKLLHAVQLYIEQHPDAEDSPMRIDVVIVELEKGGIVRTIEHYEDAVRPDRLGNAR